MAARAIIDTGRRPVKLEETSSSPDDGLTDAEMEASVAGGHEDNFRPDKSGMERLSCLGLSHYNLRLRNFSQDSIRSRDRDKVIDFGTLRRDPRGVCACESWCHHKPPGAAE